SIHSQFKRAIERKNLMGAEMLLREMGSITLDEARARAGGVDRGYARRPGGVGRAAAARAAGADGRRSAADLAGLHGAATPMTPGDRVGIRRFLVACGRLAPCPRTTSEMKLPLGTTWRTGTGGRGRSSSRRLSF